MKLTVHTFVTLDGVMQGPGAADEDPSNGFEHGGWWIVPLADPDMGSTVSGWFEQADEILIGRRTYDKMFPYWSQVTDPDDFIAHQLNNLPKHIVSRSLQSPEWQHSHVIGGEVVAAVQALKAKPATSFRSTAARNSCRRSPRATSSSPTIPAHTRARERPCLH